MRDIAVSYTHLDVYKRQKHCFHQKTLMAPLEMATKNPKVPIDLCALHSGDARQKSTSVWARTPSRTTCQNEVFLGYVELVVSCGLCGLFTVITSDRHLFCLFSFSPHLLKQ